MPKASRIVKATNRRARQFSQLTAHGDVWMLKDHQPAPVVVTYSELDSFRQCPLKHHWSYRERWVDQPKIGTPLARGSLYHLVMECHYTWIKRYRGKGLTVGFLLQWMRQHLLYDQSGQQNEDQELIEWMYEGYLKCYGLDTRWDIELVEFAGQVPLVPGEIDLRFKLDLMVRDRATKKLWLLDHKSARDFSRPSEIDLDDQFGLYSWALRSMGWDTIGTIRSDARTQRNKGPMTLEQRFRQVFTFRTETELANVAHDAAQVARAAWADGSDSRVYSSPLTFTCSWRCSFLSPHIELRKGIASEEVVMTDFGLVRSLKKHREYDADPVLSAIPDTMDTSLFRTS